MGKCKLILNFAAPKNCVLRKSNPIIILFRNKKQYMFLYNVTYKIDEAIEEEWLQWMRVTHVARVVRDGEFLGHRICKLLGLQDDDGVTYAIQYLLPNMEIFKNYQQHHAEAHQKLHREQFANRYVSFSTVLEIIE